MDAHKDPNHEGNSEKYKVVLKKLPPASRNSMEPFMVFWMQREAN